MKRIPVIVLFLMYVSIPVLCQRKYVGVINYVKGDLVRISGNQSVPVARGMVIYTDSKIDYEPEYTKADGEIQIVTIDGKSELISSFPKEFKEKKYKILTRDELADLKNFIGGHIILSAPEEDTMFEWYCNIKRLNYTLAQQLRIIISEKESSPVKDSIIPLVFQLKPGISIKEIHCTVSKWNTSGDTTTKVKWTHKKDEWILDIKDLPTSDDEIYKLDTNFVLTNGTKEQREFHYQVFSEDKITKIEKEALSNLPGDAKPHKKNVEILKTYEDYDLLLPAIHIRKEKDLIIKGLLEEIWYEEI